MTTVFRVGIIIMLFKCLIALLYFIHSCVLTPSHLNLSRLVVFPKIIILITPFLSISHATMELHHHIEMAGNYSGEFSWKAVTWFYAIKHQAYVSAGEIFRKWKIIILLFIKRFHLQLQFFREFIFLWLFVFYCCGWCAVRIHFYFNFIFFGGMT